MTLLSGGNTLATQSSEINVSESYQQSTNLQKQSTNGIQKKKFSF